MKHLEVKYDLDRDVLVVDGMKYAGALFRSFALAPVGTLLRIEAREDGVVTVHQYAPGEKVTA